MSRWIFFAAYRGALRLGGAVLVHDDPAIELLRDGPTCGLLWDLRVAPEWRGVGVGAALLDAVERAAMRNVLRAVRVETQQINVAACRFYQRHGYRLERATAGVYERLPDEIQLLWRKEP